LDISDTSAAVESPSPEQAATPKIKNAAATTATDRWTRWFLVIVTLWGRVHPNPRKCDKQGPFVPSRTSALWPDGFPSPPRVQKITKRNPLGEVPRIDYVMGLGATPVIYETVMHITGRAFNPDFQASDHQMIKAVMTLG